MSDLFENNQDKNLEQPLADDIISEPAPNNNDEESTVFSAPAEHKDSGTAKSNTKKKIISIVAACLAVTILVVGAILVRDNIEEIKDDEITDTGVSKDITVLDRDSASFTAIDITSDKGNTKLTTKQITSTNDDGTTKTQTYWAIENVDVAKLSSSTIDELVANVASITATRKLDPNTKTKEECGLNKPLISVKVTDPKNGDFAFYVGDVSPDNLGYYFSLEGSDTIYVVPSNELTSFRFELVDLTDKTAIPATIFDTDTTANKLADGSYGYFDTLTLSGSLFPETITFVNNNDKNTTAEIVPYLVTTPKSMAAQKENVTSLLTLFSKTINVAGNCAVDINDTTLKKFGLDEPDAIVTMTINGESKSFKFSKIDDEFCAVIYDSAIMIRKVALDSFAFLSLKPEDFYYKQPFMNSMNDVSSIELVEGENKVKIDLSYTESEDSVKTFYAKVNGKDIKIGDFQSFYEGFVDIRCSSFAVEEPTTDSTAKLTIKYHDGKTKTIEFYASNAIEYQFSFDGEHLGKITSASYQKLIRNIKELVDAQ